MRFTASVALGSSPPFTPQTSHLPPFTLDAAPHPGDTSAMHAHPLWIIRHGQTEWNLQHRWQGRQDSSLTGKGEAQARAVGVRLAAMGLQDTALLTSPQGRAARTAALIAEALNRPPPPSDDRLCEIDVGDWTGLTKAQITDQLGPWEGLFTPYNAAPGGEGIDGLRARVAPLLAELSGPAILVTHGITSRLLRAVAMGLPTAQAETLPGGQGVIHCVQGGQHKTIDAMVENAQSRS